MTMPAKKRTKTQSSAEPVPVTHAHIAALAKTARILAVLDARPKTAGKAEYRAQIDGYRTLWSGTSPETRTAAREAAESIHDMTPERVALAVKHLEG
jgi:hypothetical protein